MIFNQHFTSNIASCHNLFDMKHVRNCHGQLIVKHYHTNFSDKQLVTTSSKYEILK